jgi:type I restriction enzyme, S subunit
MRNLSQPKIAGATILIPPLAEQRRIVDKIDTLTAKSRRAKEALAAIPQLLERFRQSVLASAFRGDLTAAWREKNPDVEPAEELLKRIRAERRRRWEEAELAKMRAKGKGPGDDRWKAKYEEPVPVDASELPELPEGWCWVALEEISARITDGTHQPPPLSVSGIPFIGITNIVDGKIDWDIVTKWISELTYGELTSRCPIERGDVLYTAVGATYGTAVEVDFEDKFIFQRHIAQIKTLVGVVQPSYLCMALNAPSSFAQAQQKARGAAQPTVTLGDLSRFSIPLAPGAEQCGIVQCVQKLVDHVQAVTVALTDGRRRIDLLDRSILAKAFRGELVPQDPNDEPASVLLERLRAEADRPGKTTPGAARRRAAASPPPAQPSNTHPGKKPHASRRSQTPARSRG